MFFFFFSSRRRHTRSDRDWSSDVCSSDLLAGEIADGVVLWACPASYIGDVAMREIAAGRARAGQPLAGFDVCAAIPSAVVADPAVAHRGIRAERHRYFGLPFYRAMFAQAGYEADIAAYDAAADVRSEEHTSE